MDTKSIKRILPTFSLEKKVCVVTGGAGGLGYVFLQAFIESGATELAIIDLRLGSSVSDLEKWAKDSLDVQIAVIGIPCDISDETSVQEVFKQIVEKFGRVDVLVNAAGFVEQWNAEEYPTDRYKKLMSVNLDGSWFTAREAAKDMMKRNAGGSIILIASMSGTVVNIPQVQAPYNISKAGVIHMAASLAVEWAKKGIRVNALSPGYMLTALTKAILEKDPVLDQTWSGMTPVGKMGDPEDLKGAIVFLASDASKFCTGIDLKVDGGYTLI